MSRRGGLYVWVGVSAAILLATGCDGPGFSSLRHYREKERVYPFPTAIFGTGGFGFGGTGGLNGCASISTLCDGVRSCCPGLVCNPSPNGVFGTCTLPLGGPCATDAECPSNACENGVCCAASGSGCNEGWKCCSSTCIGGTCCSPAGLACRSYDECCSKSCTNGACG